MRFRRPAGPASTPSFLARLPRFAVPLALAGLLLTGGTLGLAAPAEADVLVSNIGQTQKDSEAQLPYSVLAQGFRTA